MNAAAQKGRTRLQGASTSAREPYKPFAHPILIIHRVCCLAGSASLIDDIRATNRGLRTAIRRHDTATVFDWLFETLSFQGISDRVAAGYIAEHGQVTWRDIESGLAGHDGCPKLGSYWQYHGCRFDKLGRTCAEPDHIGGCPLPAHDLRNGRLNQTAYSLYLFIRDLADSDLVGWIDAQLDQADAGDGPERLARMRDALIGPLRNVNGVSDKVMTMALSNLMLAASDPRWAEVGASMIVIDTLVHNFLHRTGVLRRWGTPHAYGAACYRLGGCAELIRRVAYLIDARRFNPAFPAAFPRFVQHAIWQFCAQQALNVCNGNRIDDSKSCDNLYCTIRGICERISLKNEA